MLKVKRLNSDAILPTKGSKYAAGYDLYSNVNMILLPRDKYIPVGTGIAIEIPLGFYGRVAPRSGLTVKNHLDVGAGVIDNDYRGEILVALYNHGTEPFEIKKGDRIAQLIPERYGNFNIVECEQLQESGRGEMGFGSTGV